MEGFRLKLPNMKQMMGSMGKSLGKFFEPKEPEPLLSPLAPSPTPDPWEQKGFTKAGGGYYKPKEGNSGPTYVDKAKIPAETIAQVEGSPLPSPSPMPMTATPGVMPEMGQKKPFPVHKRLYQAAQEMSKTYGIPAEAFIANAAWEHRGSKSLENGNYKSAVWWDNARNRGEESYGPYQINMRWFGPKAVELGRITPDNPLYITPEQANDAYEATRWMAKKWAREMRAGKKEIADLIQSHNPNEQGRAQNALAQLAALQIMEGQNE